MTPPIALPINPTHGDTPSFMGFNIKNRIVAAESNVARAGNNKAHKNNRQLNFTAGDSCNGFEYSGGKFFPQNGHQAAP